MARSFTLRFLSVMALGALAACGGSSNPSGGAASIAISSPTANQAVTVHMTDATGGADLPVAFTLQNFTLKTPGSCGTTASCGHVHVLIDGATCNDVANHAPYNGTSVASPASAGFDYCTGWPTINGNHTITLELHTDSHAAVNDSAGNQIKSQVVVMLTVAP